MGGLTLGTHTFELYNTPAYKKPLDLLAKGLYRSNWGGWLKKVELVCSPTFFLCRLLKCMQDLNSLLEDW